MLSCDRMHRFFLLSLFFVLLFPSSAHAAGWTQVELGTLQSARGLTQVGSVFVAVGNSGNVMRSTDGVVTWMGPNNVSSQWLYDVKPLPSGQILTVGTNGVVLFSSDSGNVWSPASLGVSTTLNGIDVAGEASFVVGNDGVILYSPTKGANWTLATSNVINHLYGVDALNEKTIYAVGAGGKVLWSPTGGVGWTTISLNTGETLRGVAFVDATTGYVVGTNGTVYRTTDSAKSWQVVGIDGINMQTLYGIQASGSQLVIVGDKIVSVSQDKGVSWQSFTYEAERYTFYDAHIDPDGTIWIAGTKDDVQSVIFKYEGDSSPPKADQNDSNNVIPSESSQETMANSLIKFSCSAGAGVNDPCKAVYFYGSDGKRHAFPNDKVFFTWYENFDSVKEVTKTFMSSLPLGKNVTYHPGTKMVKFQSMNTVYGVSKKGVLRAIGSEEVAKDLYGTDWNKKIDDISDAFFGNYTFGTKIEKAGGYDVAIEKTSVAGLDENF